MAVSAVIGVGPKASLSNRRRKNNCLARRNDLKSRFLQPNFHATLLTCWIGVKSETKSKTLCVAAESLR